MRGKLNCYLPLILFEQFVMLVFDFLMLYLRYFCNGVIKILFK